MLWWRGLAGSQSNWLCLIWLLKLLAKESFWKFCWYCWGASLLGLVIFLGGS